MDDIIQQIQTSKDYLPKKQRQLCEYILQNQMLISMMTVADLAQKANVGTTTVLRLAEKLGFTSFSDFKKAILDSAMARNTTSYQSMKNSFLQQGAEEANQLNDIAEQTINGYRNFLIPANFKAMEQAVALLKKAKHIYVIGSRSSAALALYCRDSLSVFMPNVRQLSFRLDYLYDKLYRMEPEDVVFVVSAWPCTKITVDIAKVCHKQGIPIVLLTNTKLNPIAPLSTVVLDTNSMNDACTPVLFMSAMVSLIQELGRQTVPNSSEAIEKLEQQLKENNVIVWEND